MLKLLNIFVDHIKEYYSLVLCSSNWKQYLFEVFFYNIIVFNITSD